MMVVEHADHVRGFVRKHLMSLESFSHMISVRSHGRLVFEPSGGGVSKSFADGEWWAGVWNTRECFVCGIAMAVGSTTPHRCGGCRSVSYCGRGCQKAHWRAAHRLVCSDGYAVSKTVVRLGELCSGAISLLLQSNDISVQTEHVAPPVFVALFNNSRLEFMQISHEILALLRNEEELCSWRGLNRYLPIMVMTLVASGECDNRHGSTIFKQKFIPSAMGIRALSLIH